MRAQPASGDPKTITPKNPPVRAETETNRKLREVPTEYTVGVEGPETAAGGCTGPGSPDQTEESESQPPLSGQSGDNSFNNADYFEFITLDNKVASFDITIPLANPKRNIRYGAEGSPWLDEVLFRVNLHGQIRWILVYAPHPGCESYHKPLPPNREVRPVEAAWWCHANKRRLFKELSPCLPDSIDEPRSRLSRNWKPTIAAHKLVSDDSLRGLADGDLPSRQSPRLSFSDALEVAAEKRIAAAAEKKLQPCQLEAYRAHQLAEDQNPSLKTDRAVFEYLKKNPLLRDEDGHEFEYRLPHSFDTYSKYVRTGRQAHGRQKNTRRKGRASGKSIARLADL